MIHLHHDLLKDESVSGLLNLSAAHRPLSKILCHVGKMGFITQMIHLVALLR